MVRRSGVTSGRSGFGSGARSSSTPRPRSLTYPDINRLRHVIEPMLDDVTVATAFQRCRAEHGLTAGVTAFRQYVRLEFPTGPRAESVTLWRPPVPPGVGVRDGVGVQPPRRAGSTPPTSTIYPGQGILFAALTRV